jgi:hypothetical protein
LAVISAVEVEVEVYQQAIDAKPKRGWTPPELSPNATAPVHRGRAA